MKGSWRIVITIKLHVSGIYDGHIETAINSVGRRRRYQSLDAWSVQYRFSKMEEHIQLSRGRETLKTNV